MDGIRKIKNEIVHLLIPSEKLGLCAVCKTDTKRDEIFCSLSCFFRYCVRDKNSKDRQVCGFPGCGKPCFVDVSKSRVFDFCGRSHASQYKELVKQMQSQGPSWAGLCGYPNCPKNCYVEGSSGIVHPFCGKEHANQYKQLQMGISVPVHCNTHQRTVSARVANKSNAPFQNIADPIYFYNSDELYYEFTNFYECPVSIDKKIWRTTEHYFQAQKFVGTPYVEIIRAMQRPREAFDLSRNSTVSHWLRKDWEEVKHDVMYVALLAKFSQHKDLKDRLLNTGNRMLIEHTWNDSYWGDGGDGNGLNMLGVLLMKVRDVLKKLPGLTNPSIDADGDDTEIECGSDYHTGGNGNTSKSTLVGCNDEVVKGECTNDVELTWNQSYEDQLLDLPDDHTDSSEMRDSVQQNNVMCEQPPLSESPRSELCTGVAANLSSHSLKAEDGEAEPIEIDEKQDDHEVLVDKGQ